MSLFDPNGNLLSLPNDLSAFNAFYNADLASNEKNTGNKTSSLPQEVWEIILPKLLKAKKDAIMAALPTAIGELWMFSNNEKSLFELFDPVDIKILIDWQNDPSEEKMEQAYTVYNRIIQSLADNKDWRKEHPIHRDDNVLARACALELWQTIPALMASGATLIGTGFHTVLLNAMNNHSKYDETTVRKNVALLLKELLKQNDIDIEATNYSGGTLLMVAAYREYPDIVKAMITRKANVNAHDNVGNTALILAAYEGHTEIVTMLLAAGADANAKNKYGETALDRVELRLQNAGGPVQDDDDTKPFQKRLTACTLLLKSAMNDHTKVTVRHSPAPEDSSSAHFGPGSAPSSHVGSRKI